MATPSIETSELIFAGFAPLVARIAREWRRVVDRRLQPLGLTEATWLPILHLARAGVPMRQNELAASLSVDNSSVVRVLDALQSAGWVERREDASDRRANAIVLTSEGRRMVARVEAVSLEVRNQVLEDLSPKALTEATGVLEKIGLRLSQLHEDAPR